ncbi:hypothetical protein N0V87_008731 [Didymella glomerata]|uniref:Uncharacterized protein n=1 Tax=Didymella glomerata TaxID=749621 RepID=A0A9W8WSH7_9PLEO|nr:hypothetical protein N0V87_008731 [Didymella glomerata]
MKTSTFITVSLFSLASTVVAAPTPQLSNILGSITNPSAGNNNIFEDNGDGNGSNSGNGNSAGSNSGNNNQAGTDNTAGSGNTVTFPSILKDRDLGSTLAGITNTIGSITNPSAGSGNRFLGNGNDNGSGSGNGNSAGDNSGNGNTAGSGNSAGNDNTINVSPEVSPSIELPDITL